MRNFEEDLFNENVMTLDTYIMFKLKEKTHTLTPELKAKNRAPISLSMGAPTANPPKYVIDSLKNALGETGIHMYSVPKGEQFFREAIGKYMQRRFNVDLDVNTEIFSLIGSKEGIANLIRAIVNPKHEAKEKDIIMVPDPGYASYSQFIQCSGGLAYPVPLTEENSYMPDMESVFNQLEKDGYDKNKVKALIINYPNNPLGASATREYVQSVIDFCKKHGILLISDAAYCELYFSEDEKPFSVFELDGAKDVAVEFFSFSKPYAITGWRLGWICGNKTVISRFGKCKSTIDNGIFKALQKAAADVLNSKEGDEYIAEMNEGYKRKQAILVNGFRELGWNIDENKVPHTTFYLWLPIPRKYSSAFDFCADFDEQLQEVIDRMKADGFTY